MSKEVPETIQPDIPEVVQAPTVMGVVVDCARLNVRKHPSRGAEVVCEIGRGTPLVIDEDASTDDFYKICTVTGIEGFCVKDFVSIHK